MRWQFEGEWAEVIAKYDALAPELAGRHVRVVILTDEETEADGEAWDRQIERDAATGKLDHLVREANAAFEAGKCKPLDQMLAGLTGVIQSNDRKGGSRLSESSGDDYASDLVADKRA